MTRAETTVKRSQSEAELSSPQLVPRPPPEQNPVAEIFIRAKTKEQNSKTQNIRAPIKVTDLTIERRPQSECKDFEVGKLLEQTNIIIEKAEDE